MYKGEGRLLPEPLIILKGNGITLVHKRGKQIPMPQYDPSFPHTIEFDMYEVGPRFFYIFLKINFHPNTSMTCIIFSSHLFPLELVLEMPPKVLIGRQNFLLKTFVDRQGFRLKN